MKSGNIIISDIIVKDHYVNEAILRKNGKDYIVYSGCIFEYTIEPANDSDIVKSSQYLPTLYDENGDVLEYSNITIYLKNGTKTNDVFTNVNKVEKILVRFNKKTKRIVAPKKIVSLLRISTKEITNMSAMFYNCSSLQSIPVGGWKTDNVTDMSYMFNGCSSLTSLDLSNWDTSKVTNMVHMFNGCSSLTSLDLSNFDTSNVTGMVYMFAGVPEISVLGWNYDETNYTNFTLPEKQTGYSYSFPWNMFILEYTVSVKDVTDTVSAEHSQSNKYYLPRIYTSKTSSSVANDKYTIIKLSNGTITNDMNTLVADVETIKVYYPETTTSVKFRGASEYHPHYLESIIRINTDKLTDTSYMFYICTKLIPFDMSDWYFGSVTDMSYMFHGCSSLTTLDLSRWNTGNVKNVSYMFSDCINLESVSLSIYSDSLLYDKSKITDMSGLFYDCSSLTTITGLSEWVSSKVENMECMFCGCSTLPSIQGVSSWDVSNVENMSQMFYECKSLTKLDLSRWSTSNVKDMSSMFAHCELLTTSSLNLTNWSTKNVVNMSRMFLSCLSLTSLDLSKWSTTALEKIDHMFCWCTALKSVNLSSFLSTATNKVFNIYGVFENCRSLTTITGISNWHTSNVTDMNSVFKSCSSLTTLDLSKWDTSKVDNMREMFRECSSLKSLDLSKWDGSSLKDIYFMFKGCKSITTLNVGNYTWNVETFSYVDYAIEECNSLKSLYLYGWSFGSLDHFFKYCNAPKVAVNLYVSYLNGVQVERLYSTLYNYNDISNWTIYNKS